MSASKPVRRITIADIARMYEEGERFATITAYDYPTARIVDEAGIPLILVGDSLGMVMLGYDTTVRVNIDEMLHHTRAVARGAKRALVVGDMPFLTYGVSTEESVEHAGRFLSEAYAQAVKIEGGVRSAKTMEAIVGSGIPVMGHIGFTPQSEHGLGGHIIQGRGDEGAEALLAGLPPPACRTARPGPIPSTTVPRDPCYIRPDGGTHQDRSDLPARLDLALATSAAAHDGRGRGGLVPGLSRRTSRGRRRSTPGRDSRAPPRRRQGAPARRGARGGRRPRR